MSTVQRIKNFNQGRESERVAIKYGAMRENAFVFLRGTCHLFYEDWPINSPINNAPLTWVCGDLHLENFGSFKGENRLAYFDLNDFDESALAPASWDLARMLTSIIVAGQTLALKQNEAVELCHLFLNSYASALKEGKAKWVERDTATGMIDGLLSSLNTRKRDEFLDDRTKLKKGLRTIKIDGVKALAISKKERDEVFSFVEKFAKTQKLPSFYKPLDVARRVAGTGSLGVSRYIVLVEGLGSPEANYLLDLKEVKQSALIPYLKVTQPKWPSEAHRVMNVQRWIQAVPPAFLCATEFNGKPTVLKELQPSQDKLDLTNWNNKIKRLEKVMQTMGQLTAWAQLRSGGRQGSATTDEWVDFGGRDNWKVPLLEYATQYAKQVKLDWQAFSKAYDKGEFKLKVD